MNGVYGCVDGKGLSVAVSCWNFPFSHPVEVCVGLSGRRNAKY